MKKYAIKILCILLLAAMVLPVSSLAAESGAYTAVQRLENAGIADYALDSFRPNDYITASEIAVMLNRVVKFEDRLDRTFTDIDPNSEAGDAMLRLAAAGILYVPAEGSLCNPNDHISRQDAVTMLYKLFKMQPDGSAPSWSDYSYIKNTDAINTFYSKGYIPQSMQSGGCFAPNMGITRGQFAQLLCNVVALFGDSEQASNGKVSGNAVMSKLNSSITVSGITYVTSGEGTDTDKVIYLNNKWSEAKLENTEYTQLIGTCTTYFPAGASGRNTNVKTASEWYINGTVLAPGDRFAFNDVVGARTYDRGFREATIFVGKEKAQGMGGGICQVSSTLFVAALNAGMTITERHQHSMEVTYIDLGLDATVSYGVLDMRFKNELNVPVKITCQCNTGTGALTISIWAPADYKKPNTVVGASHKANDVYYGYRYINGSLDWYTSSRY